MGILMLNGNNYTGGIQQVYGKSSGNIATFTDGGDNKPLKSLKVAINPVQDLHGYDAPWSAGGGKNVIPTFTEDMEDGNVTLKVNPDKSVTINGTANKLVVFDAPQNTWQWDGISNYWLSGCPQGGDYSGGYSLRISTSNQWSKPDEGNGVKLQGYTSSYNISNAPLNFTIIIRSGTVCNNLVFKPMLNSGLSAMPFEPYSNICPISGRTGANIYRTGANIWDEVWEVGGINASGNDSTANDRIRSTNYNPCKPTTTYYLKTSFTTNELRVSYYDKDKTFISQTGWLYNGAITSPANAYYFRFHTSGIYGSTYLNDISINYPSTDTSYHAYNGTTYTNTFGQTVYGGKLDVTSGVLTVTHANIASYNGEAINEPWISSEDAYSEGATPTTGAQVVYPLTTPQTVQLTPTQVKSLLGNNNLWSDTGEITECVYQKDLNIVINELDARITALEQAQSGTRSLSLSKSAVKEEETEEITEEPKEEEQNEDKR